MYNEYFRRTIREAQWPLSKIEAMYKAVQSEISRVWEIQWPYPPEGYYDELIEWQDELWHYLVWEKNQTRREQYVA